MIMKRILALTVFAALLPVASVAVKANTVTLTQGTYSYSDGGEFTAVTSPGAFVGNGYVAATKNSAGTGFQTFCMESQVYFSPGTVYSYTLGQMSQPLTGGGIGSNLPLSTGAAYLYYQFATGNLTGYDYNTANTPGDQAARKADAGALQAAIWLLQGGQVVSGFPLGNNSYYDLAVANANTSYQFVEQRVNFQPRNLSWVKF